MLGSIEARFISASNTFKQTLGMWIDIEAIKHDCSCRRQYLKNLVKLTAGYD